MPAMHTLLRGGMATDEHGGKPDWEIAAEAKLRRKKHKMEKKKGHGYELNLWTVNTGGLTGAWRVVHLFEHFGAT